MNWLEAVENPEAVTGLFEEIVPSIVESGDSRRTARYATWTC